MSDRIKLRYIEKELKKIKCKIGLAHTDLIHLATKHKLEGGLDYVLNFLKDNNIFWEINSNIAYECFDDIIYDNDKKEIHILIQKLISNNIKVTVGSDRHSIDDIQWGRFIKANEIADYINLKQQIV